MIARSRLIVFIIITCSPLMVSADKLADFKTAAGSKGCDAVPYSSKRSSCKALQGSVTKYCKTGSFSCDSLGTKGILKTIEDMKKKLASLESNKASPSEISAMEKKIAEQDKKLKSVREEIGKRIAHGSDCVSARSKVETLFANVKAEVKRESDKALQSYVNTLVKKYEAEEYGHETAKENAQKAVNKCIDAKAGRL